MGFFSRGFCARLSGLPGQLIRNAGNASLDEFARASPQRKVPRIFAPVYDTMTEAIGLDLLEAKMLLGKAKRPNLKQLLSTFIRQQTAKELEMRSPRTQRGKFFRFRFPAFRARDLMAWAQTAVQEKESPRSFKRPE